MFDIKKRNFIDSKKNFVIDPLDFHIYRLIDSNERILDVENIVYLDKIEITKIEERISLFPGPNYFVRILLRELPDKVFIDNKKINFKKKKIKNHFEIEISNLPKRDVIIRLSYK